MIWRYLVCGHFLWPRITPKNLIAFVRCMHKGQKAFKSFGTIRIKIPFVELYKECTICAILRGNTPICLAATEAKTCLAMLCRGPIIMQTCNKVTKCLREEPTVSGEELTRSFVPSCKMMTSGPNSFTTLKSYFKTLAIVRPPTPCHLQIKSGVETW